MRLGHSRDQPPPHEALTESLAASRDYLPGTDRRPADGWVFEPPRVACDTTRCADHSNAPVASEQSCISLLSWSWTTYTHSSLMRSTLKRDSTERCSKLERTSARVGVASAATASRDPKIPLQPCSLGSVRIHGTSPGTRSPIRAQPRANQSLRRQKVHSHDGLSLSIARSCRCAPSS